MMQKKHSLTKGYPNISIGKKIAITIRKKITWKTSQL